MKNYIVLDLETPNYYSNSMSSIGIVVVEDGEITDEIYSLINPEAHFDSFNISFTGIGPEDVKDAPTFPEYWEEIKDLLCSNVIVGQNISFDLSVISKSLTRYNMPIPPFESYCTLNSCKRNLNLPINSLSYIVENVLKTTYDAHNAMADAQMTNELYNYLDKYEDNRKSFVIPYSYRPKCSRTFDRNLDYNFNYLYGLIKKFTYIDTISYNHLKLIEKWYEMNKCHNNHPLIQNLLLKLSYVLENRNLTKKELQLIFQSFRPIKKSPRYKAPTLKLQVLSGILDSLLCENQIKDNDIEFLKDWLEYTSINDKNFKKFYKQLDWDDKQLIYHIRKYSISLKEYLQKK